MVALGEYFSSGKFQVELTQDDYRNGYYADAQGNIRDNNGNIVDPSQLTSQRTQARSVNNTVTTVASKIDKQMDKRG